MNLLALDTSSIACSVAIEFDGRIFVRHEEQAREHTRLLVPMIREVLQESGADLGELDAIVLGNGPGSFIGMRIAASVAQGLAHGACLKVIPVSSLAAIAAKVFAETGASDVAVAQDAHMNEVYLGLYARGEGNLPVAVVDERLQRQELIPEFATMQSTGRIAAGFGWQKYPELAAANSSFLQTFSPTFHPDAKHLLLLAETRRAVHPQDIELAYLRQRVAEKPAALRQ